MNSSTILQANWRKVINGYQRSDSNRSILQIVTSVLPFLAMWYLMYRSIEISYWLTLLLAIPTAGFMMRTFIIFHDCCHGSFFQSKKANDIVGWITGILTFTPYTKWKHAHAVHHATAGNLDKRGVGDVWTITLQEYVKMSRWEKLVYRIIREPLFMFTIGSFLMFSIVQRFARKFDAQRERRSVLWTNLALAVIIAGLVYLIGWQSFLLVQVPIMLLATSAGVWLFYVQHNFPGSYWERQEKWDFITAAMNGSSFYKLPRLLQWFSGNIGFHHIHHLGPRIPNYKLQRCYEENPMFHVQPLTIGSSLKSSKLRFWDEETKKMVGYEALKEGI